MWTQIRLFLYEQSDLDLHLLTKGLFVICAFRVNKCEFSVYAVKIFMTCTHVKL